MNSTSQKPESAEVPATTVSDAQGDGERYSIFSRREKWCILAMASWASWTSNLSVFIYLPALKPLSDSFAVSVDQINLTLTVYMAVAAVAPLVVGDVADALGRRLAYASTLGLFLIANICLALAGSYNDLLGFRALQSLGQSGIILVGYGVVSDIASPAERGLFMSLISFTITIGPSIGPVLGGALCYAAGWNWVFWFLVINTGPCLVVIALFLPETCRNLVGNGSAALPPYLQRPIQVSNTRGRTEQDTVGRAPGSLRLPNPLRSLIILLRKDNAVVVLAWGLMYAVYSCLTATLSTLLIEIYHINEWQAGMCYLPFALGGTASTFFSGWLLDRTYRNARTRLGLPTDKLPVCTIAYGWMLQLKQHLAGILIIQFLIGLALQFNFSSFNTLLVDINQKSPSSANASTSVVRCAISALIVAYIENMFQSLGFGLSFTIIGALCGVKQLPLECQFSFDHGISADGDWLKALLSVPGP
ncbi:multidrug resistance protein [Xylariomycetidae sp. FL2044]|nr:multidrug resistance protein [Xylariomycetidae sp. FL2044]